MPAPSSGVAGCRDRSDPGRHKAPAGRVVGHDDARWSSTPAAAFAASIAGPRSTSGDFQIVREIGRGGMGIVYEALQGSLNRHVAAEAPPRAGRPGAVPPRGPLRRPAAPHQHRPGPRGRPRRRPALPRHAVHRRARARPGTAGAARRRPRPGAGRRRRSTTARRRGSASRPPRPWPTRTPRGSSTATSSRRTSCSTAAGTAWVTDFGLAARLGRRRDPDPHRRPAGHAALHGAGAVRRPGGRSGRHLRAGGRRSTSWRPAGPPSPTPIAPS